MRPSRKGGTRLCTIRCTLAALSSSKSSSTSSRWTTPLVSIRLVSQRSLSCGDTRRVTFSLRLRGDLERLAGQSTRDRLLVGLYTLQLLIQKSLLKLRHLQYFVPRSSWAPALTHTQIHPEAVITIPFSPRGPHRVLQERGGGAGCSKLPKASCSCSCSTEAYLTWLCL